MTDTPNDGGPAFPPSIATTPMGDAYSENGMSLRDWFAGQALSGYLADPGCHGPDQAAAICYQYADAMIAERSKGNG